MEMTKHTKEEFEQATALAQQNITEALKILSNEPAIMCYFGLLALQPVDDDEIQVRLCTRNGSSVCGLDYNPFFINRLDDPSELALIFFAEALRLALHHPTTRYVQPAGVNLLSSNLICFEDQHVLSKWRDNVKAVVPTIPTYSQVKPILDKTGFDKATDWTLEKIFVHLLKEWQKQQQQMKQNAEQQINAQMKQGKGQGQQQQGAGAGKNQKQDKQQKQQGQGNGQGDAQDQRQQQNGQGQQQQGQGQGQDQNQNGQGQQQQGQGQGQQQQGQGQGQQQQGQGQGQQGQGQGQQQQGQGQGQQQQGQGQGQGNGQGQGQNGQGNGQNGQGQGQQGQGQGQGQGSQSGSGDDGSSSGDQGANQGDRSDPSHGSNGMDSSADAGDAVSEMMKQLDQAQRNAPDVRGDNAKGQGNGEAASALDEYFDTSEKHAKKATEKWGENDLVDEKITQITNHIASDASHWGNMSGMLKQMILEANAPKFDPTTVVKHFKQEIQSEDMESTRAKTNRRFGYVLPGWRHKMKSSILFAIDCSGSMSDEDVALGEAFVNKFIKHAKVSYCFWDGRCGEITDLKRKEKNFELIGRGCTNPDCVLEKLEEEKVDFGGLIFFTDNGFDWDRPKSKWAKKIFIISTENASEPPEWVKYHLSMKDIKDYENK